MLAMLLPKISESPILSFAQLPLLPISNTEQVYKQGIDGVTMVV